MAQMPLLLLQSCESTNAKIVHPRLMTDKGSSSQTNQGDSVDPPISKKRRGRQPRPSLLTSNLQRAITTFTTAVGKPVLQPGGFRDYTGWLESIAGQRYHSTWIKLARCFLEECKNVKDTDIPQLKKDVVIEIMKMVVTRNPKESSKLVSTNARRQCAVPSSGITVMTLLESYLEKAGQLGTESRSAERSHDRGTEGSSTRGSSRHHRGAMASGSGRGHGASQRQGGSSSSRPGASGMDISSLLVDDVPHVHRGSSSSAPQLPSLSQLDEQLRVRKEKDRRHPR